MPFGGDYVSFWTAGRLLLEGRAAEVFQPELFFAAQEQAIDGNVAHFLWNYPPTFQMLMAPFATLPPNLSVVLWWGSTLLLFLVGARFVGGRWEAPLVVMSSTACLLNLSHGQNGFLLGGLFLCGFALLREGRAFWAGIVLGLISLKPHFGVLLPVAFVASRDRDAFLGATLSVVGTALLSLVVVGSEAWIGFGTNLGSLHSALVANLYPQSMVVSIYMMLRTLGATDGIALFGQALGAVVAAGAVWSAWRRGYSDRAVAVLLLATPLVNPYFYYYDLILWACAGVFAVLHARDVGWKFGERELWALSIVAPIGIGSIWDVSGLQLGALMSMLMLGMMMRSGVRMSHA